MQQVYKLTVELDKGAIQRAMEATAETFVPAKGCRIEDIMLVGQVGTPASLDSIEGDEGTRAVRVLVVYSVTYEGDNSQPVTINGALSHDISLELLRELERIGR